MEMVARVTLLSRMSRVLLLCRRGNSDICRGLPEGAEIAVQLKATDAGAFYRSRFAAFHTACRRFPNLDDWQSEVEFTPPQATMSA